MKKTIAVFLAGLLTLVFTHVVSAGILDDNEKNNQDSMSKIVVNKNVRSNAVHAPAAASTPKNGGEIIITCYLTTVGDLYKPMQPIAGEAYQLLDPRGNVVALIRGTNVPANMEGKLLRVTADKVSNVLGHAGLLMLEEVTSSGELVPGTLLWSRPIDVNLDGVIDSSDSADISSHFGAVQGVDRIYDLNYDGVADSKDLELVSAYDGYDAAGVMGGWPDMDNDGMAGARELVMITDHMGETVTGYSQYDLNLDHKIDERDLKILKAFYGYGVPVYGVANLPLVNCTLGKIKSFTTFSDDGKTAVRYIFDDQEKVVTATNYGEARVTPYAGLMPRIEYKDGKIASITVYNSEGRPTDKYTFSPDGKIIKSDHYDPESGNVPIYIEPPDFVQPVTKPDRTIDTGKVIEPVNGNPAAPIIIAPKPVEPAPGAPIGIAPAPNVKTPPKSPVITVPVNKKKGYADEVTDKIITIGAAKTDLPAGVSINGTMADKKGEKILPAKSK